MPQPLGGRGVESLARRLSHRHVGPDTEPFEIDLDRLHEFLTRALAIGVVEAQHEAATLRARENVVEQCRSGIAYVNAPGRRGCEADERGSHGFGEEPDCEGGHIRRGGPCGKPRQTC